MGRGLGGCAFQVCGPEHLKNLFPCTQDRLLCILHLHPSYITILLCTWPISKLLQMGWQFAVGINPAMLRVICRPMHPTSSYFRTNLFKQLNFQAMPTDFFSAVHFPAEIPVPIQTTTMSIRAGLRLWLSFVKKNSISRPDNYTTYN